MGGGCEDWCQPEMNRYSERVVELMMFPMNEGVLANADRVGVYAAASGGKLGAVYLKIVDGRVVQCTFRCHGCGASIAAFSCLTVMVDGKTLSEVREITADRLLDELGGLPVDKTHCAHRAIIALQDALSVDGVE